MLRLNCALRIQIYKIACARLRCDRTSFAHSSTFTPGFTDSCTALKSRESHERSPDQQKIIASSIVRVASFRIIRLFVSRTEVCRNHAALQQTRQRGCVVRNSQATIIISTLHSNNPPTNLPKLEIHHIPLPPKCHPKYPHTLNLSHAYPATTTHSPHSTPTRRYIIK